MSEVTDGHVVLAVAAAHVAYMESLGWQLVDSIVADEPESEVEREPKPATQRRRK